MSLESKIEALTAAVHQLTAVMQMAGSASVPQAAAPAQPHASAAPFSDTQGLIQYTMSAYQAMGPEKGARIQGVLSSLGYSNINDVKPEHFGQFHSGVEALKAGA